MPTAFRQELFGCVDDCSIALRAVACPCTVFGDAGKNVYKQNYYLSACGGCWCCVFAPVVGLIFMRNQIRTAKRIKGNLLSDVLVTIICCPCAFVQLAAEVAPPPIAGGPVVAEVMER
jgi:Cys-rich protein (TIGR01571 family)